MIETISDDFFCIRKPFALGGLELGVRSSFIRLKDGSLWMHSPVDFSDEDLDMIRKRGEVSAIVAPNLFHHLFLSSAKQAFPAAKIYAAPGLEKKRQRFKFDACLLDQNQWQADLEMQLVQGMPRVNEVVFFHKKSATLLVTDLVFNLQNVNGIRGQLISRLFGTCNRPAVSRLFQLMMKDRSKISQSLKVIKGWPFEKLVMAHGDLILSGGHQLFDKLVEHLVSD